MTQAYDRQSDSANLDRFSGFAEEYNAYRPSPPAELRGDSDGRRCIPRRNR